MSLRDPLSEWSALFFGALSRAGLRDVVISPGSRSTPFVIAAAHTEKLRCWDVIDERAAAFFALGQAKASGAPSLCLCTSGSAGAHYLPALIEAAASHTPILVLTADRPLELQGCGAPQTIDQVKLFGDHVRAFVELGLPDADPTALRAVTRLAAQAMLLSQWPLPGPVHLNARARKPLEPHLPANEIEREQARRLATAATTPPPRTFIPRALPSEDGVSQLATALGRAKAPLFVAGAGSLAQAKAAGGLFELVRRSHGVLLPEAASQFRFVPRAEVICAPAFDAYVGLPSFIARAAPDLLVHIGAPSASTAYGSYLKSHATVEQWVVGPHGWNDPESRASHFLFGDLDDVVGAVGSLLPPLDVEPTRWQRLWLQLEGAAQRVLAKHLDSSQMLVEGSVAREVARSLLPGSLLAIGNSLPLREVDLFCEGTHTRCGVLSQRGANGIDGLIAGAAGAASMGRRVTLLIGDISFLHDLGGLWAAARVGKALTIVVLQNRGGRIFEDLPLAAAGVGDVMQHFTTPHVADLRAAAAIYGLRHAQVRTVAELRAELGASSNAEACQVIEALVPERGLGPLRERLARELSEVLA